MELERRYGVLLHPTCFPGPWGIGVLGAQARAFVDWLQSAGAAWWQVLPLGPTGYGDSPYQAVCSFAGNPYLIDPEDLAARGWLRAEPPEAPEGWVDYGLTYEKKWPLLRRAFEGFCRRAARADRQAFEGFRAEQRYWLADYALYRALKGHHDFRAWDAWPEPEKRRDAAALDRARETLHTDVDFHAWTQWVFFSQWESLREYARTRGVRIIGDIPIFVSHDSPEVWAHPEKFYLDAGGRPSVVAGVPPDYFSETGQLWGNPLYRWDVLEADGFGWWIERLRTALRTCDLVRVDHFRGFEAYWEVEAGAPNAVAGRWVEARGRELFAAVHAALGDAPIIAEDLGIITDEVRALRDELGLPGMKVLQFAFDGDAENEFLPERHPAHGRFVVYPGTHDNETTLGWYRNLGKKLRRYVQDYLLSYELPCSESEIPWSMIRLAMRSPGKLCIVALQDVLGLGNEARMNAPATTEGNWAWRYHDGDLTAELAAGLRELAVAHERLPGSEQAK